MINGSLSESMDILKFNILIVNVFVNSGSRKEKQKRNRNFS